MYKLFDDFRASDENKQPYSFSVERHTAIDSLHTWIKNDTFHMASIGNRLILNTPKFLNCEFKMNFMITYMSEIKPKFMFLFGYDERTREGKAIHFSYDLKNTVTITLNKIKNNYASPIASNDFYIDNPLVSDTYYGYALKIEEGKVSGSIAGIDFSFDTEASKGKLAIERADFIGELIIESILFASPDEFEKEVIIPETKVDIPLTNGGDIPYTVSWEVNKIEGEYYFTSKLDGGTKTRELNREDRPGQYAVERDWMTSPYIGLGSKDKLSTNFSIARGEKGFIDPNIFWECQKGFLGDTEIPIVNTYKISKDLLCDDLEIVFGYENLSCTGYGTQEGGSEFRFTPSGELLYIGDAADGRDIYELYSQEDKKALSYVPEDCYKREDVIEHIKYNHYFDVSEDIEFTFVMKTMTDVDFLNIKASVLNVYETEIYGTYPAVIETGKWDYGYNQIVAKIHVPKMPIGVWKAEFIVNYGSKQHNRFVKVFEVFDENSDLNPALASGLPFIFAMPNEQKWLARNAFDLWTPMRSCDLVHYYNCATDTPIEAEIRKPWKMFKKFKREWFAWVASRTCKDWSLDKHLDVVKNCDYLFASNKEKVMDLSQSGLYPIRSDHHSYDNFMMRAGQRIAMLEEFLTENPEIAEKVDYKVGMKEFTREHYLNLMETCASEFIDHQNKKGVELVREQNEEIAKINPNFKRSIYGPICAYVTPTLTNHSLNHYANGDYEALAKEFYTGFAIFEDYPYSCAYQTYRGAFLLMTILLHSPDLVLYPEQYQGGRGGCIDGAVKFAHAPMGKYDILPYQNSTHAFEFVYNTAHRLTDGFHYWKTYGFHRNTKLISGLVLDWKYVLEHRPKNPLKTTAFLVEYSLKEDALEISYVSDEKYNFYMVNQSEIGHGVVFEATRDAGIPNGFGLKYDVLSHLSKDECDVLVLPSLKYADKESVDEIRRLYNEGVNLVAVSDISGLEDIFGVEKDERVVKLNKVCYKGQEEFVKEHDAKLSYKPQNAEVVLTSDAGDALIIKTARTLLINTSVTNLGCADSQFMCHTKTPHIVGNLLRQALKEEMKNISTPLVCGENVGTTLFETEDGRTMLLAIDYTPFDNVDRDTKEAVVKINMDNVNSIKCDHDIFVGKKNGKVKELRFNILPHGFEFIELCTD